MTHMAVYRPSCVMKKVQLSLQNELDLQKSQEILRWMHDEEFSKEQLRRNTRSSREMHKQFLNLYSA